MPSLGSYFLACCDAHPTTPSVLSLLLLFIFFFFFFFHRNEYPTPPWYSSLRVTSFPSKTKTLKVVRMLDGRPNFRACTVVKNSASLSTLLILTCPVPNVTPPPLATAAGFSLLNVIRVSLMLSTEIACGLSILSILSYRSLLTLMSRATSFLVSDSSSLVSSNSFFKYFMFPASSLLCCLAASANWVVDSMNPLSSTHSVNETSSSAMFSHFCTSAPR